MRKRLLLHKAPASKARGLTPLGTMNQTERRYSEMLQARQLTGEVEWWKYEAITLTLAHDTRYTPDFAVMLTGGLIEFHEVKGFWRDDARVKVKVAQEQFPIFTFRTVVWDKDRGSWKIEEVGKR